MIELKSAIQSDTSLQRILSGRDSLPAQDHLYPAFAIHFSTQPYLSAHFDFELFAINRSLMEPLITGQPQVESMRLLESREQAINSPVEGLRYWPRPHPGNYTYVLDLKEDHLILILFQIQHVGVISGMGPGPVT